MRGKCWLNFCHVARKGSLWLMFMLTGCGGGGGSAPPITSASSANSATTALYSVGGSISGLIDDGLQLRNGSDVISVPANATTFVFPTSIPSGSAYLISGTTLPPGMTCRFAQASGTVKTSNITDVFITCNRQWSWMAGSSLSNAAGVYGVQGVADGTNIPGARGYAATWTDRNGNLWLFGGYGTSNGANGGLLGDMWMYNTTSKQWMWVDGPATVNVAPSYGSRGVADDANQPGGRSYAMTWTDVQGRFWLYGGVGIDKNNNVGDLGDLWRYDTGTRQWTWVQGSNIREASPSYGTQGVSDKSNTPGARDSGASFVDSSGNLWLFGGYGYDAAGTQERYFNDLWRFSIATGFWTWINGSNLPNVYGTYGAKNVTASGNAPGSRYGATSFVDAANNFYIFGGYGYQASGAGLTAMNDLWRYSRTEATWTWVGGNALADSSSLQGSYGTQGVATVTNLPGARSYQASRVDAANTLWVFGGYGYDRNAGLGNLNDLWRLDVAAGMWIWQEGSRDKGASGTYPANGPSELPAIKSMPRARTGAAMWIDAHGRLWIFGGGNPDDDSYYNDLFRY